ncbi:MAG: DNA adenine methylase [Flavobacteriales bacterium]
METLTSSNDLSQFALFPGSRYMGSKQRIAIPILEALSNYDFRTVVDLFAGSNVMSYLFKSVGKGVISNDFMHVSYACAKALIENQETTLSDDTVGFLVNTKNDQTFISKSFEGLYFSDGENQFLDRVRCNIDDLPNEFERAIALTALSRACVKKRARGIFTYTGHRYDDGRKDLRKSLSDHFLDAVTQLNNAVFSSGHACQAHNQRALDFEMKADLVYMDPPYFTPNSDNDYVRRYHFVEGLVRNWKGLEIQDHTKTKKFKSYPSPFASKKGAQESFESLVGAHRDSILAISYSSNSIPTKPELIDMLEALGKHVEVVEIDLTYSFGNQGHKAGNRNNRVKEYLFIAS